MCDYENIIDVLKIVDTKEIYFNQSPVVDWELDITWTVCMVIFIF